MISRQRPLDMSMRLIEPSAGWGYRLSRRAMLGSLAGMGLASLAGSGWAADAVAASSRELFHDTNFAEGFGAAWRYGEQFSPGGQVTGKLLSYRNIAPYQVHLIPEGPIKPGDTRAHPWDFEEGIHLNFTDSFGTKVSELHEQRLAVNHVLEINTPERLKVSQFNNYYLAATDTQRNRKLVKRVDTDRRGTIRLYYNSQNEIRNAALAYGAQWRDDTWPHFLLVQRFLETPRLGDFRQLDWSLEFRVHSLKALSDWPAKVPGGTPPEMFLQCFFFLVGPKNEPLWVGLVLYVSKPCYYVVHADADQWGMAYYREPIGRDNVPLMIGQKYTVKRELKALVGKALVAAAAKSKSRLPHDPNEYRIGMFNIGWEGLGHWECDVEISGLSLQAPRRKNRACREQNQGNSENDSLQDAIDAANRRVDGDRLVGPHCLDGGRLPCRTWSGDAAII